MNVEKTIEFLLEQQARADFRFEKALERMDRADKRMDRADKRLDRLERVVSQTSRVVTRLVRYGVSLRSDVRRHDKAILRIEAGLERIEATVENIAESQQRTDGRLNTLIKLVDRTIRRNGKF
jgi:chromosome segregation ATPase